MVQVNLKKSQLSGWGHYAEPTALFINKVPDPFMAGDIIDISATLEPGGTELHFTDGTILSYRQSGNLLPALDNVTVWSVPAEGTTVPNNLDYVEIHASYTTKKGKVINAIPAKVPVATPSYLRVIVPNEPLIDEGEYFQTYPQWEDRSQYRGIKSACQIKNVRFVVYWTDSQGNVIATSDAKDSSDNPLCYSTPFVQGTNSSGSYPGPYLYAGEKTASATFTRYRSIEDEGEEITLENAMKFVFKHKINNITLQAETYFQNNPIVSWGFFNLPTSYSGSRTYTIDVQKNTKVRFKNGKVQIGQWDRSKDRYWLSIFMRYKVVGGWYEYVDHQTVTFADGRYGAIDQFSLGTYRDSNIIYKVANRYYTCSGGEIKWSNTQPW